MQINKHEPLLFQKCDEWADYLSKEIIHKGLALHGNLNVIASSITPLSDTQTNKKTFTFDIQKHEGVN